MQPQNAILEIKRNYLIKYLQLKEEKDQDLFLRKAQLWKDLNHDVTSVICNICHNILVEPVILECYHYFCDECFKKLPINHNLKKCPTCEQRCLVNLDQKVNKIKIGLKQFQFKCFVCQDWKGNFYYLKQHLNQHRLDYDYCKQCNEDYLLIYEQDHMKYDCPKRKVLCPFCDVEYFYGNLEEHNCKEPQICQECNQQYDDSHQCQQNNKKFSCIMKDFGCSFSCFRLDQLEQHVGCTCQHQFMRCEICSQFLMKKDLVNHDCRGYDISEILDQMKKNQSKEKKIELLMVFQNEMNQMNDVDDLIHRINQYFGGINNFQVVPKQKCKKFLILEADNIFVAQNFKSAFTEFRGNGLQINIVED